MRIVDMWSGSKFLVYLGLSMLAVLARSEGASSAPPKGTFASPQDVLQWINNYRARPEPERLPDVVTAIRRLGLLRDIDAAGVYVGFVAGVIGTNAGGADNLVARMFPIPPVDQVLIVRGIAYSGLPGWQEMLGRFSERMPARKVLIQRFLDGSVPTLDKLALDSAPSALDANWGYYLATGRKEPINRMIAALDWVENAKDLDQLTAGSMAKWTLANNALQDRELLDYLKAETGRRTGAIRRHLGAVIEAAETYETGKIRKEAQAAIEEFRQKGSASQRKLSFWGEAGQTALALGCVVAGALGHPEIAVPCVVGGAASSAALRLFNRR